MNSITADEDLASSEVEDAADGYFSQVPHFLLSGSGNAIKLYCILTTYLNNRGPTVWPSRKTLAGKLGLGKPASVDRYLTELEALGGISIVPRYRTDGGQSSSAYRIHIARRSTSANGVKAAPKKGQGSVPKKGHPPVPKKGQLNLDQILNPEEKPMPDKVERPAPAGGVEVLEGQVDAIEILNGAEAQWAAFWDAYPRKAGKKNAFKAWTKAIKTYAPDLLISAARAYRDDPNREDQFTKYPEGWINQNRWEDPPLPPRRGSARPDRAEEMFHTPFPIDPDGMVTLPSGRRIPSGVIASDQLAIS